MMATMANFAEISKILKSSETAQGFNDNNGSHTNSDLSGSNGIMASTLVGSVVLNIMVNIGVVTLKVVMAIMVTIAVMDVMVLMTYRFDGYNFSKSTRGCVDSNGPHCSNSCKGLNG